jgi:hypothetical protein
MPNAPNETDEGALAVYRILLEMPLFGSSLLAYDGLD